MFGILSWLRSAFAPVHPLKVVVFVTVIALDAKGWALLTLVGGFLPCPLVPQYVQVSWSLGGAFFCFLQKLPATASVA